MNLFTFPLFCCTMILPVIFVGHRVVQGVPYNSFVVNNAYKQYKCAIKCLFFWNLGLFWVIYLTRVRSLGHRPLIVKRVVIGSPGGWKLSTIFML